MTLVIGVTGGIASGKSTATAFFAARGVPVLDADEVAREVVAPGSPGLLEIQTAFGKQVLCDDGSLNRKHLREIIFADAGHRKTLEQILHPRIHRRIRERLAALDTPWVVLSVPLLVGSPLLELIDRVLVVDTTEQIQIARVIARDNVDHEQADAILQAQASREQRLAIADDVVDNSTDPAALTAQLERLADLYDQIAQSPSLRRRPRHRAIEC